MATPKKIFQTSTANVASKTVTVKTVVQEITLFNGSGSSLSFSVFRIPAGMSVNNNPVNLARVTSSVAGNSSTTLSNLRWVLDVGETLYIQPSNNGQGYNIFVDGVEFE